MMLDARGEAARMNEHWASQSELCALHQLRYDFVGRHDELRHDTLALEGLLGVRATPPSGSQYGWDGNRNASRLLDRFYKTRAMVARVGALFRADLSVPLNGIQFRAKDVFGSALPPASTSPSHHKKSR